MKRFSIFWGCTIPARFPFIEKSTRLALDVLGAEVVDIDGYTCCPEGTLVKAVNEEAYYVTAAAIWRWPKRRVAAGHAVQRLLLHLQVHPGGVQVRLAQARRPQRPPGRRPTSATTAAWSSSTWRVAPRRDRSGGGREEGGQAARGHAHRRPLRLPPAAAESGHPLGQRHQPHQVRGHGARPGSDGGGLRDQARLLRRARSTGWASATTALQMCRNKLIDLKSEDVDALVVVCPSCFQQFDLNQATLLRQKEDLEMPVFYYTELLCSGPGRTRPRNSDCRCTGCPPTRSWRGGRRRRAAAGDRPGVLAGRAAEVQRLQGLRDRLPGGQAGRPLQPHHHHRGDPLRATWTG